METADIMLKEARRIMINTELYHLYNNCMKKCSGLNSCLTHPWPQSIAKRRKETEWKKRNTNIKG